MENTVKAWIDVEMSGATSVSGIADLRGCEITGIRQLDANLSATTIYFESAEGISDDADQTPTTGLFGAVYDNTNTTLTITTTAKSIYRVNTLEPAKAAFLGDFVRLVANDTNGSASLDADVRIFVSRYR